MQTKATHRVRQLRMASVHCGVPFCLFQLKDIVRSLNGKAQRSYFNLSSAAKMKQEITAHVLNNHIPFYDH